MAEITTIATYSLTALLAGGAGWFWSAYVANRNQALSKKK